MTTCPHDAETLHSEKYGSVFIDHCARCSGVWFDAGEIDQAKHADDPFLKWIHLDLFEDEKSFSAKSQYQE